MKLVKIAKMIKFLLFNIKLMLILDKEPVRTIDFVCILKQCLVYYL